MVLRLLHRFLSNILAQLGIASDLIKTTIIIIIIISGVFGNQRVIVLQNRKRAYCVNSGNRWGVKKNVLGHAKCEYPSMHISTWLPAQSYVSPKGEGNDVKNGETRVNDKDQE